MFIQADKAEDSLIIVDYLGGLYKSEDAGVSWKSYRLPDSKNTNDYDIDGRYKNLVFDDEIKHGVVIVDCVIHQSSDGGMSWSSIPVASMDFKGKEESCVGAAYLDKHGSLILASGVEDRMKGEPRALKQTLNNGATWQDVSENWPTLYDEKRHPPNLNSAWRKQMARVDSYEMQVLFDAIFHKKALPINEKLLTSLHMLSVRPLTNFSATIRKVGSRYWATDENRLAYSDNEGKRWHVVIDREVGATTAYAGDADSFYFFTISDETGQWYRAQFVGDHLGLIWEPVSIPVKYDDPQDYNWPTIESHIPSGSLFTYNQSTSELLTSIDFGQAWVSHGEVPEYRAHGGGETLWMYHSYPASAGVKLSLSWSDEPPKNWTATSVMLGNDERGSRISCTGAGCFLTTSGKNGYLIKPDESGKVKPSIHPVPFDTPGGQSWFGVFPHKEMNVIWAYTNYRHIYQTKDAGHTWKTHRLGDMDRYHYEIETSPNHLNTVLFRSGRLASSNNIPTRNSDFYDYVKLDDQEQLTYYQLPHKGAVHSHEICWLDDNHALLALWDDNYHHPEVLETSDGGLSWQSGTVLFYPNADGCHALGDSVMINNRRYKMNF